MHDLLKNNRPMDSLHRRAILLLLLLAMFLPSLAQRTRAWKPSPADHGMLLPQDIRKRGGTVESPIPTRPEEEDPNAGDVPVDPNDDESEGSQHDEKPRDIHVQPLVALQIHKVELYGIGVGSDIGKAGDKAVVITGQGFADSESSPIIHLGDEIILDQVYVSEAGRVLIALLPAEIAAGLRLRDFAQLAVQNPGGMNRDPQRWARFPLNKPQFVQDVQSAVEANFKRGEFFVQRMR